MGEGSEQARGDGQGNRVRIPDGKRRCICLSRTGVDENRSLGNWEGSPSRRWLNLFNEYSLKDTSQKTYKKRFKGAVYAFAGKRLRQNGIRRFAGGAYFCPSTLPGHETEK